MLSLGLSFADVSITGSINQTVGSWKDGGVIAKNSFTALGDRNLASGDSLLTFAGSEDLGDGLKASFKFEPRVNISGKDVSESAQKGLFGENREAWIGLNGAFGTVHLGNNYTPLFLQSGAGYDPNGFTNMTGYLVSNVTSFNATNSIDYTAPKFVDGLGIQLNKNFGGKSKTSSANTPANEADSFGWGLSYSISGFSAGVAGENSKYTKLSDGVSEVAAASSNDLKKLGISASYDFGVAKVSIQSLNAKLSSASTNTMGYGLSVPIGAFTLSASISTLKSKGSSTAANNDSYNAYQLGAKYALSKRTSAYFLSSQVKNSTDGKTLNVNAAGVVHNF